MYSHFTFVLYDTSMISTFSNNNDSTLPQKNNKYN